MSLHSVLSVLFPNCNFFDFYLADATRLFLCAQGLFCNTTTNIQKMALSPAEGLTLYSVVNMMMGQYPVSMSFRLEASMFTTSNTNMYFAVGFGPANSTLSAACLFVFFACCDS
jgi:hypothetical protein